MRPGRRQRDLPPRPAGKRRPPADRHRRPWALCAGAATSPRARPGCAGNAARYASRGTRSCFRSNFRRNFAFLSMVRDLGDWEDQAALQGRTPTHRPAKGAPKTMRLGGDKQELELEQAVVALEEATAAIRERDALAAERD